MKIRSKINEIMFLSILLKDINFDCFVSFEAHINQISIRLFDGLWKSSKEPISIDFGISDHKTSLDKADRVIWQLKSILKKHSIDYSTLIQIERIEIDYTF